MNLRNPWFLLLLVPLILWLLLALKKAPAAALSPVGRLRAAGSSWRTRVWWLPELFQFFFLALAVVLLAGPQRDLEGGNDASQGLAIAIVLDRSGSMAAIIPYQGKELSRLDGVKSVTHDFLEQRQHDQFALVSFARYPETNAPLTGNRQVVEDFLGLLAIPTRQEDDGTAIGDALILATARLNKDSAAKGVIILLTDGQNNQGEKTPEDGAKIAAQAGIPVYCIALGGDGYIVQDTIAGKMAQQVPEAIDEATLSAIASQTGGRYYHALKPEDLQGFYADIAQRETTKLELARPRRSELNLEPGLAVLLALLAATLLSRHLVLRRMDP